MMQKSAVNGSQGGSGIDVVVDVAEGIVVGVRVGEADVDVIVKGVFMPTAVTGLSVTGVFTQDTRNPSNRQFNIRFIWVPSLREQVEEAISKDAGDCFATLAMTLSSI